MERKQDFKILIYLYIYIPVYLYTKAVTTKSSFELVLKAKMRGKEINPTHFFLCQVLVGKEETKNSSARV